MDVTYRLDKDILYIAIDGRIDATNATEAEEKIFTQAEANSFLKKEEAKIKAKYSDYAELKEKAAKFDELAEANKTELEKANERAAKLQAELDKLNETLAESKDMLLRTAAEFDNFKRRTEKEKTDIAAFVKADVVKALLPVADNIERAKKSGVKYIAQPGGSVRDDNVIETCNKYGMTMCFTGLRLFHH